MKKIISVMIVATMLLSLCVTAVSAASDSTLVLNVYSEKYEGTPAPKTGTFKGGDDYDVYKVSYTVSGVDSAEDKITSLGISFSISDPTKIAAKSWLASVANPPALKDANGFVDVVSGVQVGTGVYGWADNNGIDAFDWTTYPAGGNYETLPYAETLIYVNKGESVTFTYSSYKPDGGQATSYIVLDSWLGGNERSFENAKLNFNINGKAGNVLTLGSSAPTPVVIDDEGSKNTASGATGLTDLQGNTVPALSKNYGIAQFSTTIDTAANDYVLAVEDSDGKSTTFDVDFAEIGVEAASATVDFFAVVKSLTHTITSMVLQAVAK